MAVIRKQLGGGDYSWMYNSRGIRDGVSAVLDISAFTKATHYPDGYIPCGTPVVVDDDLAALVPWTDAAGNKLGFVGGDFPTDGTEDVNVHVITHPETVYTDHPVLAANGFAAPATASVPHINFVTKGA